MLITYFLSSSSIGDDNFFLTTKEHKILVRHYEHLLQNFCWNFQPAMPLNTVGTACFYMKRLYLRKSVMEFNPRLTFLVCVWLACKVTTYGMHV